MTTTKLSVLAMDAKRIDQTIDTLIDRISTHTVVAEPASRPILQGGRVPC